jgi:hypothetical protein
VPQLSVAFHKFLTADTTLLCGAIVTKRFRGSHLDATPGNAKAPTLYCEICQDKDCGDQYLPIRAPRGSRPFQKPPAEVINGFFPLVFAWQACQRPYVCNVLVA